MYKYDILKKMKTIYFLLLILVISVSVSAQEDVSYKVTNYSVNGVNYDDLALLNDVVLGFYMCDANTLCFVNQWRNTGSQSYGGVFGLVTKEYPETSTTHEAFELKFTWKFYNSYDSDSGEAAVSLTHIYVGNTVKFTAEILIIKTNEILKMKGYME